MSALYEHIRRAETPSEQVVVARNAKKTGDVPQPPPTERDASANDRRRRGRGGGAQKMIKHVLS